uniref:homogentisate 1,2-dioxygenase n=1 Tax=Colletotrichum fructicola (strain Nara gc5) TaxID=1213859 RepID=L2G3D1_COLFN
MVGATAASAFSTEPTDSDPHRYQTGFGNRFCSEAVPGTLPPGQNAPQKCRFDLYSEQLNGSSFISSRATLQHVWMYRIWPSVAHRQVVPSPELNPLLQACFSPLNDKVKYVAGQQAWDPFQLPGEGESSRNGRDFVEGIRTVGGQGDPTLREGIAVHVYTASTSMSNRAFCNNDGDFLILPQKGRLNIQTELGWLMVRPGELAVIQAGLRFRVLLPDGPSRGYIQEIFGTHYELPELGPIGSNGMALPQDFESPVASFDVDSSDWEIVYKLAGSLHACRQGHTPFDVVTWRGNLVPYKYATEKFINVANVNHDQADPTVGFPHRTHYHRNMSTERMGLLYGTYGGSSHVLEPGGLSYEASYMPHGETYETWQNATTKDLKPDRICEGTVAFMFHISVPVMLTQWAIEGEGSKGLHLAEDQWDGAKAHFLEHLDEVEEVLTKAGLPNLGRKSVNGKVNGAVNGNGVHGIVNGYSS